MIGIYLKSSSSSSGMLLEKLHNHSNLTRTHVTDGRSLWVLQQTSMNSCIGSYASRKDKYLLCDGYVLHPSTYEVVRAQTLLDLLVKKGPESLVDYDGEFLLVFVDGPVCYIISDRMGTRQHYWYSSDNEFALAPKPTEVLRILGVSSSIDFKSLLTFILVNKMRFRDHSIWSGAKVFPPASIARVEYGKLSKLSTYTSLQYSPDSSIDLKMVSKLTSNAFRKALEARTQVFGEAPCLALSGGLDSRLLLGVLPEREQQRITALSMGIPNSQEVALAEIVSRKCSTPFKKVTLFPESVFKPARLKHLLNDEIDLITQTFWQDFADVAKASSVVLHGLDLDATIGGIYLSDRLMAQMSKREVLSYVKSQMLSVSDHLLNSLFRKDVLAEYGFDINAIIEELVNECWQKDPANTFDCIILKHSMSRVILSRYRMMRSGFETLTPMYDKRLIDLYLRTPPKMRLNRRLFHTFVQDLIPNLAHVPYQRTMLPPSAPIEFWEKGSKIENVTEELYRQIAHTTNGNIHIPYNRYYTNVDEWLRFNRTWIEWSTKLLQTEDSIIRRMFCVPTVLDRLLKEHRNHDKSHMKIIHHLMSAELYLRYSQGWLPDEHTP